MRRSLVSSFGLFSEGTLAEVKEVTSLDDGSSSSADLHVRSCAARDIPLIRVGFVTVYVLRSVI